MHTLTPPRPVLVHRDRGLRVALLWLLALSVAGAALHSQLAGLAAVAPFLAAALSERVRRVLLVAVLSVAVFVLNAESLDEPWDEAQWIRLGGVVVAGAVAVWTGVVRARERRSTVSIDRVARTVQTAVMRLQPLTTDRATTAMRYRSADVRSLIGGDAIEAVSTPWGLRVLVADACGKGLSSMRASAMTLGAFREWAQEEADLADLLDRLHRSLARELSGDDFVTALVAQLDGLELSFASAGHPMPMLVRHREVTELGGEVRPAPPLALAVPRRRAGVGSVRLMAGDVVLMVTDGLLEARDPAGRFFPIDVHAGECLDDADVSRGVDRLIDAAARHTRASLADDIAVVAVRVDDGHRAPGGAPPESGWSG